MDSIRFFGFGFFSFDPFSRGIFGRQWHGKFNPIRLCDAFRWNWNWSWCTRKRSINTFYILIHSIDFTVTKKIILKIWRMHTRIHFHLFKLLHIFSFVASFRFVFFFHVLRFELLVIGVCILTIHFDIYFDLFFTPICTQWDAIFSTCMCTHTCTAFHMIEIHSRSFYSLFVFLLSPNGDDFTNTNTWSISKLNFFFFSLSLFWLCSLAHPKCCLPIYFFQFRRPRQECKRTFWTCKLLHFSSI